MPARQGRTRRASAPGRAGSAWVFAPPTTDDLIRVLSAWRLLILAGIISAAFGAAVYAVAPPPYRARATVNVDFHLEQAWPQNTDREQFYYLERETRKLVEVANSDEVLEAVTRAVPGTTLQQLRDGAGRLSQPGNGGWHFFGMDRDANRASSIASTWASAFTERVNQLVAEGKPGGPEQFITAELSRTSSVNPERSLKPGMYMLASVVAVLGLGALVLLLLHPRK